MNQWWPILSSAMPQRVNHKWCGPQMPKWLINWSFLESFQWKDFYGRSKVIFIYIYIYIVCIYLFFQHHCIWPKMSKKKSSHPVNLQCSPSRLTTIEWVCSLARMDAGREWHLEWLPYTHTNPISREKLPEIICWTLHYNWEIKLTVQLWAFISFSSDDNRGADSI